MESILMWLPAVLTTTPQRWINLIEALPVTLLGKPPAPKEWSALDCLQHLTETEQHVFPVRVKSILAGKDFPAFDPDAQGTVSPSNQTPLDQVAEFARLRTESLSLVATLKPEDLSRTAIHAELGRVTMSELLHEWAAHDLMHIVQAERAMMQPFISGCGPWQPYFADHAAKRAE